MRLSDRIEAVAPSATLAVTAKAKALRSQGVDVLALSAGEPDFDTPDHIKAAAKEALDRGDTKYTPVPGTPALREAVAKKTAALYQRETEAAEVIVSAGGKQVLFNACAALLNPGDEVILGAPYWVSYPDMIRFAQAKPTPINVPLAEGFLPKAEAIASAMTAQTRLIILNSPSNPTGAAYTRAELEDIAEVLRKHPDVFVITDDIYEALVYDQPFVGLAHVAPDLKDRMLIASGVSKSYAMTGWRLGFAVGPKPLINAMGRLQGASTSGACSISQAAAVAALTGDQGVIERQRDIFKGRRDRIVQGLSDIPNVEVFVPGGAFYIFPKVDAYYGGPIEGSQALCTYLLEEVHLAAVPGVAFGADAHIRLSFACSDEDIAEAMKRLKQGLSSLN